MTSSLVGVVNRSPAEGAARRSWWTTSGLVLAILVTFGVGAGLVFYDLSTGHALLGLTEYDDGVYFGATMHLVAGQLPYRAFVLVQPPGITLLLAPIALIVGHGASGLGLAIARVVTGVVVGIDAALVVWILRYRGLIAAFTGGLVFAIYPSGFDSDRTLMLEPYLALFCLISVGLAFRNGEVASNRRLFFAGIALGFAGAIKLFAVAVAVAFLVMLLWRCRRALRPLVLGALVGFVVPCLPFFIGAPSGFIHDVFTSQMARNTAVPTAFVQRLSSTVGLMFLVRTSKLVNGSDSSWPWIAAGALGAVSFFGVVVPGIIRRNSTLAWFALVAAIAAFAMVLIPQQFYTHYAYLASLFFSMVVGGAVGTVIQEITRFRDRRRRATGDPANPHGSRGLRIAGALTVVAVLCGAVVVVHSEAQYQRTITIKRGDPAASLDKAIPPGACAISEAESLLVIANRLNFSSSCPIMVDATGTWLTYAPKYPPRRNDSEPKNAQLVALWKHLFEHVQYATFAGVKAFRVPFTPALSQWFNDNFVRIPGAAPITFKRRPYPITNAASSPGVVP